MFLSFRFSEGPLRRGVFIKEVSLVLITVFNILACLFSVPSHAPVNVTSVAHNSTTISVSWEAVPEQHRNGKIIAYIVNIYDVSSDTHKEYVYKTSGALNLNMTIGGLKKYTKYEITVSAKTSKGDSEKSLVNDVQTAQDGE